MTFLDVPEIEIEVINWTDQPSRGIGEPVTVPVAAAIANAIYDATGARERELPITPERVLRALESPDATPVSSPPATPEVATPVS